MRGRIGVLVLAVSGFSLSLAAPTVYAHGGDSSEMHACVKRNGQIRIIGPSEFCRRDETTMHWIIACTPDSPVPAPPTEGAPAVGIRATV